MSTNTVRRAALKTAAETIYAAADVELVGDVFTARRKDSAQFTRQHYIAILPHVTPFPGVDPGTNIRVMFFSQDAADTQDTTARIDALKTALEAIAGTPPVVTVEEPWRTVWNTPTTRKDEIHLNTYWED